MKPGDCEMDHFLSFQRFSKFSSQPFETAIRFDTTRTMTAGSKAFPILVELASFSWSIDSIDSQFDEQER
jgi:hypothetical protein